jgi:hypothetical protein
MIDKRKASEISRDLLAMAKAPDVTSADGKAIMRLIVDRIASGASSEAHAARAIRAIVDHETFFPPPSAIVEALETAPRDAEAAVISRKCQWCHGDGWKTLDGPLGTSAAYPCDHRGGQPHPNLGVSIPASVSRQYAIDMASGEKKRKAWEKAGSPSHRNYKAADELLARLGMKS